MLKKSVSIIVLVSFVSFIIFSCTAERATQPGGSRSRATGGGAQDVNWLDDQLSTAPEVRELLDIRDAIVLRAVEVGITSQQVRETANDPQSSNELLGYSKSDAQRIHDRIHYLIGSLCGRYPVLGELMAQGASVPACDACDMDRLVMSWDTYARTLAGTPVNSLSPARAPLKCKWAQLIVGFGLCAAKSGGSLLFYAICSYGVFCGSCDGGAAEVLCPR